MDLFVKLTVSTQVLAMSPVDYTNETELYPFAMFQSLKFTAALVASFIAYMGVLSVVAQVSGNHGDRHKSRGQGIDFLFGSVCVHVCCLRIRAMLHFCRYTHACVLLCVSGYT